MGVRLPNPLNVLLLKYFELEDWNSRENCHGGIKLVSHKSNVANWVNIFMSFKGRMNTTLFTTNFQSFSLSGNNFCHLSLVDGSQICCVGVNYEQ